MPRIMSESGRVVEATTANHNPVLWGLGGETRQNPPKETAADAAPNPLQGCKDEGGNAGTNFGAGDAGNPMRGITSTTVEVHKITTFQ